MTLRPISFIRQFTCHAEGSVLISMGRTQVLCTASLEKKVPPFLKESRQGWITAEYGMLPRATNTRVAREAARGQQSGRTQEIQRLIGRSIRAAFDLDQMTGYTLTLDCDVLQADGGTRTAAISGAMVAAYDAFSVAVEQKIFPTIPLKKFLAAVSVGIVDGQICLDLNYEQDVSCDTDMNIVMNEDGDFIEIQGTAEGAVFSRTQLDALMTTAQSGIFSIIAEQKKSLGLI